MSGTLLKQWPLDLVLFSSPVYWSDEAELAQFQNTLEKELTRAFEESGVNLKFHRIQGEPKPEQLDALREAEVLVLFPLSGGSQEGILEIGKGATFKAVFNGYLPESGLSEALTHKILHRNGHPASTDSYAYFRQAGHGVSWLSSLAALKAYGLAWQASQRLRHARLLKIGETEPWVINSCRDPQRYRERLGVEIVPMEREALYDLYRRTTDAMARKHAERWRGRAGRLLEIGNEDILKACRVVTAMETLLQNHEADGLSMACFAMIGDIDTTSCLALSTLNDSASYIGACEGDLEAGVTLFLLKALGADFVWIGNPIIHPEGILDLVHCTAPVCGCGTEFKYQLTRHHESGRGVSPEVQLPAGRPVTLARIGGNLERIVRFGGVSRSVGDKLPACHTQIRVELDGVSSRQVIDSLLGTHLVLTFGDFRPELDFASRFLGLKQGPDSPLVDPSVETVFHPLDERLQKPGFAR